MPPFPNPHKTPTPTLPTSPPFPFQDNGLRHAELVLEFYLAGGVGPTIDGQPNVWYLADGCASKLVAYLNVGCTAGKPDARRLQALAKTFVAALDNPSSELQACLPDIPAVLLALTSTYCPAGNFLHNPLLGLPPTNPASNTACGPDTVSCSHDTISVQCVACKWVWIGEPIALGNMPP